MGGFMIQMGLYSSWGCIVSISVFDWGCISFSKGWGSIQEWGCIEADTVSLPPWAGPRFDFSSFLESQGFDEEY